MVKDPKVTGTSVQLCRRVGDQLMVNFRVSGTGHDGQYTIEPSDPPAVIDNAGGTWVASHSITVPATTTMIPTVKYWVASNGGFPSRTVTFTVNIPINAAGCTAIGG